MLVSHPGHTEEPDGQSLAAATSQSASQIVRTNLGEGNNVILALGAIL